MKRALLKILLILASPKLTAFLLFYCVLFIFLATLQIPENGIAQVQAKYFEAWFAMCGWLPLFGGKIIGVAALANLFASTFIFVKKGIRGLGFATVHIALALLIISAFVQGAWRKEGVIILNEASPANRVVTQTADGEIREVAKLPFSVELVKFTQTSWQNTDLPSHYSSLVKFRYEDAVQEKLIKMNEPASFGSWTFYQSSFANEGRTSVLQAVHNPAARLPWISIALIFGGMAFLYIYKFFMAR